MGKSIYKKTLIRIHLIKSLELLNLDTVLLQGSEKRQYSPSELRQTLHIYYTIFPLERQAFPTKITCYFHRLSVYPFIQNG